MGAAMGWCGGCCDGARRRSGPRCPGAKKSRGELWTGAAAGRVPGARRRRRARVRLACRCGPPACYTAPVGLLCCAGPSGPRCPESAPSRYVGLHRRGPPAAAGAAGRDAHQAVAHPRLVAESCQPETAAALNLAGPLGTAGPADSEGPSRLSRRRRRPAMSGARRHELEP